MTSWQRISLALLTGAALTAPAAAQTIKIGELNSYKAAPAFLEPYKKGMELAVEEINAKGGVLGKKLEVISRDDGGNPGDAVRVAEELVTREGTNLIAGTFLSNVGLAVTEFAGKKQVFFLAAEPLTDKITWQNGNKYTYRLRSSTYMQVAMLMPDIVAAKKKRWALVYPNFEYGQSAAAALQGDAQEGAARCRVRHRAGAAARQGRCRRHRAGDRRRQARRDLQRAVRPRPREVRARGQHPRRVQGPLRGEPAVRRARISSIRSRMRRRSAGSSPAIPGTRSRLPDHQTFLDAYQKKFNDYPRLGSVVGYVTVKSLAAGIAKAGSTDTAKVADAFAGLKVDSPFGPFVYRGSDHQATMGAYVGKLALKDGKPDDGRLQVCRRRRGAAVATPR